MHIQNLADFGVLDHVEKIGSRDSGDRDQDRDDHQQLEKGKAFAGHDSPSISDGPGAEDEPNAGLFGDLALLRSLGLDSLSSALAFDRGKLLRRTPFRQTWELPERKGDRYFLKKHLPAGGPSWLSLHLRRSRRERRAFEALREIGLPVPRLLAWGESRRRGAFLLWRGCAGEPLDRRLERGYPRRGGASAFGSKTAFLQQAADLAASLHRAGFVHRDLYLCHLLWDEDVDGGGRLHLIDLQRVGRKRLRRWYVKDLAALQASAPAVVSRADRFRFLGYWLRESGFSGSLRRWAGSILRKAARIAAHVPKYG